ncbi:hypothetical protein MPTK1_6g12640 [Marchantia polymorpha subsp. ruderalis]|uniref:Uncharacterized protein n=2 Tax=Marchantia polymorpha TaxID=3197 RepID=A0AAF6BRC9_MARPO|nr:hypothetical protein MARPO_0059s0083 [Marchantia polymorpha]BBN14563.1 hypothetical protein Mp_6g12640 [Marchantia polymorpha subsp. ruderalis]|eukprot:PTQ37157.1 hypothetical protein MARPO_0059s0083 [Marchantia polymorpha]
MWGFNTESRFPAQSRLKLILRPCGCPILAERRRPCADLSCFCRKSLVLLICNPRMLASNIHMHKTSIRFSPCDRTQVQRINQQFLYTQKRVETTPAAWRTVVYSDTTGAEWPTPTVQNGVLVHSY